MGSKTSKSLMGSEGAATEGVIWKPDGGGWEEGGLKRKVELDGGRGLGWRVGGGKEGGG